MNNCDVEKNMEVITLDGRTGIITLTRRGLKLIHNGSTNQVVVQGTDGLERRFSIASLTDSRKAKETESGFHFHFYDVRPTVIATYITYDDYCIHMGYGAEPQASQDGYMIKAEDGSYNWVEATVFESMFAQREKVET